MNKKYLNPDKLSSLLLYFSIMAFLIAFNFQHNPTPPWYQQFMPDLNNRPISDITFTDSLTGYAVTGDGTVGDTNYILKTENGGDNWSVIHTVYRDLSRVIFLNNMTGYICGGFNVASQSYLVKTIDGGNSWNNVNIPSAIRTRDMSIINEDTMWIINESINISVYRTTNAGTTWESKFSSFNLIPKIYMLNDSFGFLSTGSSNNSLWRTTNSGLNWTQVPGENGFRDMYFVDSLTGWKAFGTLMKKTTDGGITWITQPLPAGGIVTSPGISNLSATSRDTLWGVGGHVVYPKNSQARGLVYRTTDGGENWLYQVPDTSINIYEYRYIQFINQRLGWAYTVSNTGINTVSGGDSIFYPVTSISQIGNEVPSYFVLHQNYPNPFNPVTKIKFDIPKAGEVKLIVYDIIGKEVSTLVNEKLSTGSYEYTFDGSSLPSGIYFYSLITDKAVITKKMILTK
jgi:photosystem II stability/assembly factor-like uncharacterized protein